MKIINIKRGARSYKEYMGCILYADLVDERGVVECSATLDYILVTRFKESHKIKNYFTALKKGLDFKEKLIQKLPKK